jgi:hypothetical protein
MFQDEDIPWEVNNIVKHAFQQATPDKRSSFCNYSQAQVRILLPVLHSEQYKNMNIHCVGFEVSTAVVMKSIISWDATTCSLLRCNRRFGGTNRLQLQGRRKNSQQEPAGKEVAS